MQSLLRGRKQKKKYRDIKNQLRREKESATLLQGLYRGRQSRQLSMMRKKERGKFVFRSLIL